MAASPQPISGNVALCSISGPVTRTDGTVLAFGVITFNSFVPQVVGGHLIQPLVISADTDASGQFSISLPQGLLVQITVSDAGLTYPPMSVIVPLQAGTTFNQLVTLKMPMGVPEAPTANGPWARMGANNTWVPTVPAPAQTTAISLAYNPANHNWVQVFTPATTDPANVPPTVPLGNTVLAWDPTSAEWVYVYRPAVTNPNLIGTAPLATDSIVLWDNSQSQGEGAWVTAYLPAVTNPASATTWTNGQTAMTWDSTLNQWVFVYPPAVVPPPSAQNFPTQVAWAWDIQANYWVSTVWNPPIGSAGAGVTPGTYGWKTNGQGAVNWDLVMSGTGVTNGTAAPVGEVGESRQVIQQQYVPIYTTAGAPLNANVAQLGLSAGDWDISAFISWDITTAAITGSPIMAAAQLITTPALTLQTITPLFPSFKLGTAALPSQQLLISGPVTVFLQAWCFSGTASDANLAPLATGFIHARRMR